MPACHSLLCRRPGGPEVHHVFIVQPVDFKVGAQLVPPPGAEVTVVVDPVPGYGHQQVAISRLRVVAVESLYIKGRGVSMVWWSAFWHINVTPRTRTRTKAGRSHLGVVGGAGPVQVLGLAIDDAGNNEGVAVARRRDLAIDAVRCVSENKVKVHGRDEGKMNGRYSSATILQAFPRCHVLVSIGAVEKVAILVHR